MDFALSDEQKMIQSTVRDFVAGELIPLEREIMNRKLQGHVRLNEVVGEEGYQTLRRKARDIGLESLYVPKEYGGMGLGTLEVCLIREELGKTFVRLDTGFDPPATLYAASEEIKEKYLWPCIRGEKRHCFAQTEPDAGSDPANMQTKAIKDGHNWILNGTKTFIGEGDISDFALVPAVTDRKKGVHGISLFIVDHATDSKSGYNLVRLIDTLGDCYSLSEISMEDCVVPACNLVGEEGAGFILAQKHIGKSKVALGAACLGMSERMFEMAKEYSKQRVTFGKPLSERQAIQWMLADSAVEIHAMRCMVYECAWRADQGMDVRHEGYMVKLYCTEAVGRIVDRALQIFGAAGYSNDLPIERFYRNARGMRILGGASEVMRMAISRRILRD